MTRNRVLLVGVPEAHAARTIARAHQLDIEVIIGDTPTNLEHYASLITEADQVVAVEFKDFNALHDVFAKLQAEAPVTGVISFKEAALANTARLIETYKLKGVPPHAINTCIDKFTTRQHLGTAGLLNPIYRLCRSLEEVRALFEQLDGPMILKPHNLQGSVGVFKVTSAEELEALYNECRTFCTEPVVLAEEFLIGQEISLEAMVYQGDVVLFGITEKLLYPGSFVEAGHISPYQGNELTHADYQALVEAIVNSLGITFGPLHIEGFHTKRGFVIGEVHTRYGGDNISTLTELASQVDMTSPILAELCEIPYQIQFGATPHSSMIRFLDVVPGTVTSIEGVEALRNMPGVVTFNIACEVGSVLKPITSSFDRAGWILVQCPTREDAEETMKRALSTLHVATEPVRASC